MPLDPNCPVGLTRGSHPLNAPGCTCTLEGEKHLPPHLACHAEAPVPSQVPVGVMPWRLHVDVMLTHRDERMINTKYSWIARPRSMSWVELDEPAAGRTAGEALAAIRARLQELFATDDVPLIIEIHLVSS